jgi:hypothetical protein
MGQRGSASKVTVTATVTRADAGAKDVCCWLVAPPPLLALRNRYNQLFLALFSETNPFHFVSSPPSCLFFPSNAAQIHCRDTDSVGQTSLHRDLPLLVVRYIELILRAMSSPSVSSLPP